MRTKLDSIKIYSHSEQGHRPSNEDSELIDSFTTGSIYFRIFGVFDGHGGEFTSKTIKNELIIYLKTSISSIITLEQDLLKACREINQRIITDELVGYSGSCALFSLLWYNEQTERFMLTTANIGDSRSIISSDLGPIQLNREHKPVDVNEKTFIEKNGGEVLGGRIDGMLAVSRAFGDLDFIHSGLRCIPEFTHEEISLDNRFLILACDGLWDVNTNDEIMIFIEKYFAETHNLESRSIAKILTDDALEKNSTDNVTVIVCDLMPLFAFET